MTHSATAVTALVPTSSTRQRQRQREVTESLVTAVTTARGIAFPPTVDDLDELPRQMVLEGLVTRFDSAEANEKLPLAFALARYGDVRLVDLVSQISDASPDDFDNLVVALRGAESEALTAIRKAAGAPIELEPEIRLKARLAMLSLYLGDSSLAADMSQPRADPIQRTVLIDECSSWCGDLIQLKELASEIDNAPLRSALSLVVGGVSPDSLSMEQREALLTDWHQHQPDTGTVLPAGR